MNRAAKAVVLSAICVGMARAWKYCRDFAAAIDEVFNPPTATDRSARQERPWPST